MAQLTLQCADKIDRDKRISKVLDRYLRSYNITMH